MKQILQNLGSGETLLADVPAPGARAGYLRIATRASLVSLGTEKMLLDFGKANLLEKGRRQPEKVKQVLQKVRTDGLFPTLDAVKAKLDQPIPLGYSNVGVILDAGQGDPALAGFADGQRVVSNGPHAEVVCVPRNLCAKVPDGVNDEEAAFTVVGAIALQGIRLAAPTIGETVVVTGLGLIGLLAVQILRANGCQVLATDPDSGKCEMARRFGAVAVDLSTGADPISSAMELTAGRGADGVLVTASTSSNEPIHQAARMCRKRGRIVLVGVTGLALNRADFYEKELSFQVSCSYGPGRYDPDYEERGHDYPVGHVRWTEQRNFEAVLQLLADGRLDVKPLISHRFKFDDALKAYETVGAGGALGILLEYDSRGGPVSETTVQLQADADISSRSPLSPTIALLGAGNFSGQVLLPAIAATGARLRHIVSANGVTGTHLGKKFGFELSGTDALAAIGDLEVNTVFIATRHDSHARLVLQALEAGKHVFVEKPLCLTLDELEQIREAYRSAGVAPILMVGFNRRFSPLAVKMHQLLASASGPKAFVMTVNAGAIPANHWVQDPEIGGGRIIGEACHFVDLLRFLAGSPISDSRAFYASGAAAAQRDVAAPQLSFEDGSIGTVHYLSNGSKTFPKERLEAFCDGHVLQLDNWRSLRGFGWPGFRRLSLRRQDKGHRAEVAAFINAIATGRPSPIPFQEIDEVARVTFSLAGTGCEESRDPPQSALRPGPSQ